ncbi:MAG: hypothetical protein KAR16_11890 [Bacteroidales bacterium]|nr:hypothetical protein [Bacteroidales bacterium]
MTTTFLSLEQLTDVYKIEQDWLFEKLLEKLNSHRHLILAADQGWGVQEYVSELGFQLAEKNPDIHICYMDIKTAHASTTLPGLFAAALSHRFPEITSRMEIDSSSMDTLRLPALIAKRKKIRVAVFLANSHLLHRFRNPFSFLRTLKLNLKNQKNCIFCLYGNNNQHFRDLVDYPGPLSGLGQLVELKHNPSKHRSTSIRKLFHDHEKNIGYTTSVHMSYMVDNHPFYLKLLAWHALIRTRHTCTLAIIENAMNDLIHHFDHRFYKIVESLTPKQLSFLKALTEGNQKLYSKDTRGKYQLGSTSNIARIKQSLEKKEMIDTGNRETVFTDPIFREWLRRRYFSRP